MKNGQLEMTFQMGQGCRRTERRGGRQNRAQWWFARMRQVVERATDWQPAPCPRPEQTWFSGSYRQISVQCATPAAPIDEPCQVCE